MGSVTDWDSKTVIGHKSRPAVTARTNAQINAAQRSGGIVSTTGKGAANKNVGGPDHQRIAKLDRENEVAPPKAVPLSLGRILQKARQDHKDAEGNPKPLSQGDLARLINQRQTVVQEYENAKGTPNPQILGAMERVLKVKLRGKDIGAPLAQPKKKGT